MESKSPALSPIKGAALSQTQDNSGAASFTLSGGRPQLPLTSPIQAPSGEIANALKDLRQNYEQLENDIVENTKKQRQDQIAKHKQVLT